VAVNEQGGVLGCVLGVAICAERSRMGEYPTVGQFSSLDFFGTSGGVPSPLGMRKIQRPDPLLRFQSSWESISRQAKTLLESPA
jgi:hypothetical protein